MTQTTPGREDTRHGRYAFFRKVQPTPESSEAEVRGKSWPQCNSVEQRSRLLEAFLLYFCAIGAQMTQPVESWIRRAATRCAALGSETLQKR